MKAQVAQLVEQLAFNQLVLGSNPSLRISLCPSHLREEIPPGSPKIFERKDTDGDGKISREEHEAKPGQPNGQAKEKTARPIRGHPSPKTIEGTETLTIRQTWHRPSDTYDQRRVGGAQLRGGSPPWVIPDYGNIYFGARVPKDSSGAKAGYPTGKLFDQNLIGRWIHYGFTYDRAAASVAHFVNGKEVSREKLTYDQPLTIGAAAIGNWGLTPAHITEELGVQHLIGRIDDLSLWKVALTTQEMAKTYEATRP